MSTASYVDCDVSEQLSYNKTVPVVKVWMRLQIACSFVMHRELTSRKCFVSYNVYALHVAQSDILPV